MTKNCQVEYRTWSTNSGHQLAQATLNAAGSLNALNLDMIESLYDQLALWEKDPSIVAVILNGAGGKAFCAGGDIRQLHDAAVAARNGDDSGGALIERFFTGEYSLDYQIHSYTKPVLCWGSGIVMGGGIGLMAGASHRVVTETSKLAMPEVVIGLFPDVGGSWILGRMPGRVGLFLGLTGGRINGADALFCGLADRFLAEDALSSVIDDMRSLSWTVDSSQSQKGRPQNKQYQANSALLNALLRKYEKANQSNTVAQESPVREYFDQIQQVTDTEDLSEILSRMQQQARNEQSDERGSDWWQRMAAGLENGSPTTAALVVEQIRRAHHMALPDVFRMELEMAVECLANPNFTEGVRALLLERGTQPDWQPSTLESASLLDLEGYFSGHWKNRPHPLQGLSIT